MEPAALFATAFVVGFSGAMMPGPMLTMVISETARRGFWAGPLVVAGHAVIELLLVIGLLFGLSHVIQLPAVTGTIGILGGFMLMRMGWSIGRDAACRRIAFTASVSGEISDTAPGHSSLLAPVAAGIATSLANPYWSLWWATVGAGYVVLAMGAAPAGIPAFFGGHILSDLTWYSLVSAAISTGRNRISDALYRAVLLFCGVLLALLGGYFLYDGSLRLVSLLAR